MTLQMLYACITLLYLLAQHKRLNFKKHGYMEYQRAEEERQKARKAAQDAGVEYIPKVCVTHSE